MVVPDEYMGDVMGQITSKRGTCWAWTRTTACSTCAPRCRRRRCSITPPSCDRSPRAAVRFSWKLDHYAEVPHNVAEKVIAEHESKVTAGDRH